MPNNNNVSPYQDIQPQRLSLSIYTLCMASNISPPSSQSSNNPKQIDFSLSLKTMQANQEYITCDIYAAEPSEHPSLLANGKKGAEVRKVKEAAKDSVVQRCIERDHINNQEINLLAVKNERFQHNQAQLRVASCRPRGSGKQISI